jgi:hypothetical protein
MFAVWGPQSWSCLSIFPLLSILSLHSYLEDGGSRFLQNTGNTLTSCSSITPHEAEYGFEVGSSHIGESSTFFWNVTPSSLVEGYRCLEGTYCLHLQQNFLHSELTFWVLDDIKQRGKN